MSPSLMRPSGWGTLAIYAVGSALVAAPLPEVWRALVTTVLLGVLPGWGWTRQRTLLGRLGGAVLLSLLISLPLTLLGRTTGLGAPLLLSGAAVVAVLGARQPALRRAPMAHGPRVGLAGVAAALLLTAHTWWDTLARPLDAYWWFSPAETTWEGHAATTPPTRGGGWEGWQTLGGEGAVVLRPHSDHADLLGPAEGPVVLALRGPVGASLSVGGERATITRDVVVQPEEGPVARYLDRGVAAITLDLHLGPGERLALTLSDPARSLVYLLPSDAALWSVHGMGALRFVHYYQLLNMVEQLRWADALGETRFVTDVQPPLWSWVLAGPLTVTRGELPTANVLLLLLLGATGVASLTALHRFAPHTPLPAWLLPAAALCAEARLLYEPGSAALPDALYTLSSVAAIAALPSPGPFLGFGLLAQLSRYPGTLLVGLAALLDGQPRLAGRLLVLVLGVAGAFAVVGALSGALEGWWTTVRWETGPEHWHGESDPAVLASRVLPFYAMWLGYAGGTPLLAALAWPRGTRVVLGTALLYSLLLCTIDHSPSHYFLPLVQLSALACATTAQARQGRYVGGGIATLGLLGLWISLRLVPISG